MKLLQPDYKKIYTDIITKEHPHKLNMSSSTLQKNRLTTLDIVRLNYIIFDIEDKNTYQFNQKHRSYNESSILEILEFQIKNKLNNTKVANHFKVSRNTIAKWKKIFAPRNQSLSK